MFSASRIEPLYFLYVVKRMAAGPRE
jgi:hypothetical protein